MDPKSKDKDRPEPPLNILDPHSNTTFIRREYLGRGGFARCWEFYDSNRKKMFAGKVVAKCSLTRSSQRHKMKQEIAIHRDLNHENVVQFYSTFEDKDFIYIIIELCNRRTLMELHKRRKTVTEPEARYFSRQIANGCRYLHQKNIIHRDLKLANLFLNEDLVIKIGDFGLATMVHRDEKKETLCGTPNYIAPEILNKVGHSFQVDSWSLGCILYTLLVGRPPFETKDLEKTYALIKSNTYKLPPNLSDVAKKMIERLLDADPKLRPNMTEFLKSDYLTKFFIPDNLPISCLTTTPRFDHVPPSMTGGKSSRTPLYPTNQLDDGTQISTGGELAADNTNITYLENFDKIQRMVKHLLEKAPSVAGSTDSVLDPSEEPGSSPIYWISRWVDYSDKYGMGYELCDNSYGVLFNDVTRLLQTADGQNLQYINKYGKEDLYTSDNFPSSLNKKVDLLTNFKNYMQENLCKAGENAKRRACDAMARLPFLVAWVRTSIAIVLYLSNGTLQMNFFEDHVKIILCPLMKAISIINQEQKFRTFSASAIETNGLSKEMSERLTYAIEVMGRLKGTHIMMIPTSQSSGVPRTAADENQRKRP